MIPSLGGREPPEPNPDEEPNLNFSPPVSLSGVEGKLDLLWLSSSPASS